MRHCVRWEEVRLNIPGPFDKLSPIKGNLPLLRSLTIDDFQIFDSDDSPESLDCFSLAPRLCTVAIGNIHPTTSDISTLPWCQISDLKLHFFNGVGHVNDVLRLAAQTRSVTLSHCFMGDPPSNLSEEFTHSLESLSVILGGNFSDQCFRVWTMPRLNCLHLSIRETDSLSRISYTLEELPSFVQRSGCVITTLSLVNMGLSDVEAIMLLQCLTSLADLTYHEHPDDKKNQSLTPLLQKMTIDHRASSSTHFLPHLKKINFRIHFPFATSLLVSMVQSRWIPNETDASEMGVDCLGVVKIQILVSGDPPVDPLLRSLLVMRARGLQCTVSLDMLD
ncbi:hypothetical protein K435DRAFT_877374 [Dendrothele bispora CBS 962.96]|uniref:RNI-like protein n=1 Tax=Dendrothele bispora (strain CBS 962.96) TaxID=1314807 RepID=A0A4S8KPZ7_DENBC|nr:hypothetical protein K435DRAFT_877374 [Dendrothele bispora CBS 962.96]